VNTAFGDAAEGYAGVEWASASAAPNGDTLSLFGKSRAPTDSDGDDIPDTLDKADTDDARARNRRIEMTLERAADSAP
jgi:flagellar motor protein MotB